MNFPPELIDPIKKDKEWLIQYARAAHYEHRNMFGPFSRTFSNRIDLFYKYMRGDQPVENYKKHLKLSDQGLPEAIGLRAL